MRHKWTENQDAFIKLHYPSLGSRYCADHIGLSRDKVKDRARSLGVRALSKEKRLCRDCNIKPQELARRTRRCSACNIKLRKSKYEAKNSPKQAVDDLSQLDRITKHLAKTIRSRNKILYGLDLDLRYEHLKTLYTNQNGKCFYTGRPLKLQSDITRDPDLISVDRVDSELPYIFENMVLTIWMVNKVKHNLSIDDFVSICRDVACNLKERPA